MLKRNRFIVYDYDPVHQTALHWAAKRNRPEIIGILVDYGAFIDSKDIGGRTPLFVASKCGNIKCVKALL
jgi:ankyrin repeat protein